MKKIRLDNVIDKNNIQTYSIVIHLNEKINTDALQEATSLLSKRVPFLSARLVSDKYFYYIKVTKEDIKITKEYKTHNMYYIDGNITRVIAGDTYFKLETLSCICDYKSLLKIMNGLVIKYFSILGMESIEDNNFLNLDEKFIKEEGLPPFENYKSENIKINFSKFKEKYHFKNRLLIKKIKKESFSIIKTFDANKFKNITKNSNVSISEYLLLNILKGTRRERYTRNRKNKKEIVVDYPINARTFFDTKTLRNFEKIIKIKMPEKSSDITILNSIKSQLKNVKRQDIEHEINTKQNLFKIVKLLPIKFKSCIFNNYFKKYASTTAFYNVGEIKLPKKLKSKISHFEFVPSVPTCKNYVFSFIRWEDTLTFGANITNKNVLAPYYILKHLENRFVK